MIEAMKQALEALEIYGAMAPEVYDTIIALRVAIEAAEKQEPVAYDYDYSGNERPLYAAPPLRQPEHEPLAFYWEPSDDVVLAKHWTADKPPEGWTPLYTTPPAAQQEPGHEIWFEDRSGASRKRPQDCQSFGADGVPEAVWVNGKRFVADTTLSAAPVQEPVAWELQRDGKKWIVCDTPPTDFLLGMGVTAIPLYTTPLAAQPAPQSGSTGGCAMCGAAYEDQIVKAAQRQPLTRQQVEDLFEDGLGFEHSTVIVRAIEAAHHIK